MATLVTGAHGFIGRYVVEELLSHGDDVLALDHHQEAALGRGWPEGVQVFLGDVRDEVAVTEAMAHVDGWVHLAAVLGTQETIQNPRPAALSNLMGGLNVLEAAAQYRLPGVYICVGNHWMNNTYSITKTMVERFVRMYNADRGTSVNLVRCVNAYGPRQVAATPFGPGKVRKITPAFVCRALTGRPIEVYGDGEQVSDMVWVGDVAHALVAALDAAARRAPLETVIECGPPADESRTVNQIAEVVAAEAARVTGRDPVSVEHLPMRPGETPGAVVQADAETLRLVGVDPTSLRTVESGMRATVEWFAENEGVTWQNPGA